MAEEPNTIVGDIPTTGDFKEIELLVEYRRALRDDLREEEDVATAIITQAKVTLSNNSKPILIELKMIDNRLAKLLLSRKRSLWARFGKVITLPGGVIRYRTDAKSLDTPKNTAAIIAVLEKMRGGKRYITYTPTLNRDAITHANISLQRRLRHLGVWVGKHAFITIKSTGDEDPTTLDRRRFYQRFVK